MEMFSWIPSPSTHPALQKVGKPVCPTSPNWTPTEKTLSKRVLFKSLPRDLTFDHTWAHPQLLAGMSLPLA